MLVQIGREGGRYLPLVLMRPAVFVYRGDTSQEQAEHSLKAASVDTPRTAPLPELQQRQLPLEGGGSATLCLLPYRVDQFDPSAFATHGLSCPPAIARSVAKRQAEYFHGRLAARQALSRYGMGHLEVGTDALRAPCWPPGIIGSISHNGKYAAAVVLRATEHGAIGIDIETVADADAAAALASVAVDATELAWLRSHADAVPLELLLTLVFSAKESFYKAAFPAVRRIFDFSAVRVSALDLQQGHLEFELREVLCPTLLPGMRRRVRLYRLDADTICTSCNWGLVQR